MDNKITIKVSNAKELEKLERNLIRAEHLNDELVKTLEAIQKIKLAVSTENGQISNTNSNDDDENIKDIESSIAVKVIDELENYDLSYESWLRISNEIEDCYHS